MRLNQDKREHLLTIITQDDVIDWQKYADLAGLYVPNYDNYDDLQSESTVDSSAWKDPTPQRYIRDMMEQKLATTEEIFYDTIKIVIKQAIKYIEHLYYRQNKEIDKKDRRHSIKF